VNLADPRMAPGRCRQATNFFAAKERMLTRDAAVFIAGKYDENGKWMGAGKRGADAAGPRLCVDPSRPARGDTQVRHRHSHFTGNYPPAASDRGLPDARATPADT